jgi:hypothetical protein
MHYSSKTHLDDDEMSKYQIPNHAKAYKLKFDHIIEERSYDIENQLIDDGYQIHSDELIQVSTNVYNYIVIAIKS